MEVQLKRTKITKSIMSQVMLASITQMTKLKVLGWVLHDHKQKILFYDSSINNLMYTRFPKSIEKDGDNKIRYTYLDRGITNSIFYQLDTEELRDKTFDQLIQMKDNAKLLGQIFL